MSTEEKLMLLKKVRELYEDFLEAYAYEGSRGYRTDLRNSVISKYNRFERENSKLPANDRIKSAVVLKLSA